MTLIKKVVKKDYLTKTNPIERESYATINFN